MQDTSRKRTVDMVKLLQIMQETAKGKHAVVSNTIDEINTLLRNDNVVLSLFIGDNQHQVPYNGISINYMRNRNQGIDEHHLRFMQRSSPFACSFVKTNAWGAFTERYIQLFTKKKLIF